MESLRETRSGGARQSGLGTREASKAKGLLVARLLALLALTAALFPACSVGHGEGRVAGTVFVAGCRREGPYDLQPTTFLAQAIEQVLRVRLQRGSDIEVRSDGLEVLVEDASAVRQGFLGRELPLGGEERPVVDLTLYLNESCPAERDKTPVVLGAVSGTIRFDAIYAPQVDDDGVRIKAQFVGARFEDPRTDQRWAELDGSFEFLYVRGSPAQRFP